MVVYGIDIRIIGAMIAALSVGQPNVDSLRAGLMVGGSGEATVAIAGAPLAPGTPVTVVIDYPRPDVRYGRLGRSIGTSATVATREVEGPFYEVIAEAGAFDVGAVGIAVVGRAAVTRGGSTVRLHVGSPPMEAQARSCTSSEGIHFTLWDGVPLKSRRLWHFYLYLGYDTEPTCTPADYQGG